MLRYFKSAVFSIFLGLHFFLAYQNSYLLNRKWFPFNSWNIYHSKSFKEIAYPQVLILKKGQEVYPEGKDLLEFEQNQFPRLRDRYDVTNLSLQIYYEIGDKNLSKAKLSYESLQKILQANGSDLDWELVYFKVNPLDYYKNPESIQGKMPFLRINESYFR